MTKRLLSVEKMQSYVAWKHVDQTAPFIVLGYFLLTN